MLLPSLHSPEPEPIPLFRIIDELFCSKMIVGRSRRRKPITSDDVITVNGRYLYVGNATNNKRRLFIKGIAFPTPPPNQRAANLDRRDDDDATWNSNFTLDLSGWNAVLDQLATETDVNTVRVYEMDCRYDYSAFLGRAAELGIYVIVPLTSRSGVGVLSRDVLPPKCFPKSLAKYGMSCLEKYWEHPNVLAGVIGNEVMNDLQAWKSAPCVKAYLQSVAAYGRTLWDKESEAGITRRTALPLMYATQHDTPVADMQPDEAIKLTLDYVSCRDDAAEDNVIDDAFIFGINIESWCSSLQSFEYEENGVDESSYHSLWRTLAGGSKTETIMDAVTGATTTVQVQSISPLPVSVPVVFSEMGCSKELFNRDNTVQPTFVRDWKQVSLVSETGPMADIFSGFVAYGYDGGGNSNFRMMGGENDPNWDGEHPLPPSSDYNNFREELSKASEINSGMYTAGNRSHQNNKIIIAPSCQHTIATLRRVWGIDLHPQSAMTFYTSNACSQLRLQLFRFSVEGQGGSAQSILLMPLLVGLSLIPSIAFAIRRRRQFNNVRLLPDTIEVSSLHSANYGSLSSC